MRRPIAAALLAACSLAVAGCKSDSEKLVDLRSDLRARLDALYARYGGSGLANDARADAEKPEADAGSSTAARLLGQLDRSYFEGYCLSWGRGERPFNLSGKLDAFMKDPSNQDACRDAAKLDVRVRDLEAKLARP